MERDRELTNFVLTLYPPVLRSRLPQTNRTRDRKAGGALGKVQRPVLERDDEAKPDVHADHVRCTPQQAAEGAASILMRHEQPPVI